MGALVAVFFFLYLSMLEIDGDPRPINRAAGQENGPGSFCLSFMDMYVRM